MEYEMADGSQFSLRDVWTEPDGHYLSVTAFVDGKTYVGKLEKESADAVDDVEIAESLQLVPPSCIHPRFPPDFQRAPSFNLAEHYLKGPSFVADDCRPGKTVVADNLLREAAVFERLRKQPHPNIVPYYGCVLEDIRITQLCLKRCVCNLLEYAGKGELLSEADKYALEDGIEAGIRHLHSLGLAHNDINPTNICIDLDQKPVIIDFDSCLPFGEAMIKGPGMEAVKGQERPKSDPQNDWRGLERVVDFLWRDSASERSRVRSCWIEISFLLQATCDADHYPRGKMRAREQPNDLDYDLDSGATLSYTTRLHENTELGEDFDIGRLEATGQDDIGHSHKALPDQAGVDSVSIRLELSVVSAQLMGLRTTWIRQYYVTVERNVLQATIYLASPQSFHIGMKYAISWVHGTGARQLPPRHYTLIFMAVPMGCELWEVYLVKFDLSFLSFVDLYTYCRALW
nr:serine/threonine-protein kinase ppk4 [Quercus suber]